MSKAQMNYFDEHCMQIICGYYHSPVIEWPWRVYSWKPSKIPTQSGRIDHLTWAHVKEQKQHCQGSTTFILPSLKVAIDSVDREVLWYRLSPNGQPKKFTSFYKLQIKTFKTDCRLRRHFTWVYRGKWCFSGLSSFILSSKACNRDDSENSLILMWKQYHRYLLRQWTVCFRLHGWQRPPEWRSRSSTTNPGDKDSLFGMVHTSLVRNLVAWLYQLKAYLRSWLEGVG